MRPNRRFTREFKLAVVQQVDNGKRVRDVAAACEVSSSLIHRWRRELRLEGHNAFRGHGVKVLQQKREEELLGIVGRQAAEIDFLKRVLQRLESEQLLQALTGELPPITPSAACEKKPGA